MTNLPINSSQITLIATGKVRAEPLYTEQADGSNVRVKGAQGKTDTGMPIWQVDVLLDDDDQQRADAITVKVPGPEMPVVPKFQPVNFNGLICRPRVDWRNGNKLVLGMVADSVDQQVSAPSSSRKSAPTASAASE